MLTFVTHETVWAVLREREEDVRKARPHTATRPQGERRPREHEEHRATELWLAPNLRAGNGAC